MKQPDITVKKFTVNKVFCKCPECGSIEIRAMGRGALGLYWYNRCDDCGNKFKTYKKYPYIEEESLEQIKPEYLHINNLMNQVKDEMDEK